MDIDFFIVIVYFLLTLGVGIWSGRNIRTMREFSVDCGRISCFALYATIFATYIGGGSTIGMAGKTFSSGIVMGVISVLGSFDLLLIGLFIAPKMEKFLTCVVSPGELAGIFWERWGSLMTGITGLLYCLGGAAVQVSAIGYILQDLISIPFEVGAWIGFGLLVVYSVFGGIRAVVATDAIQYIALAVSIPLVTYFAISDAGGIAHVWTSVPPDRVDISPLWTQPMRYLPILASYLMCLINPVWVQRLLMGKDINKTKKSFCLGTATLPIAYVCAVLIGLSALVTSPEIEGNSAMVYTIQRIVPIGLKGVVVSGLLAILMSTADSYLNIAGVMLACDIFAHRTASGVTDKEMLQYGRLATLGIGLFSLLTALYYKDIIDISLYFDSFWYSTVVIPLIASICGYKSTTHAFKWATSIGGAIAALWLILDLEKKTGVYGFFPAMTANIILFFGLSAYGKRHGIFTMEETERIQKRVRAINALRRIERQIEEEGGI
ncbi:MAG: sodium:solute symporter family protein [Holosporales bacterium]|jgi:SSS family solute:Na+ symporter|nr:sodium:solute symporter family protein [Holosporales bacterium]